jgi:hypothetical protein
VIFVDFVSHYNGFICRYVRFMDFVDDYNVLDGTLVAITESHPPDVRLNYLGKKGLLNGYCKVIVQGDPGYYFRRREQNWYPREEGIFHGFHKVYISGDHGAQFSCNETVRHESAFFKKWQIEVHLLFSCSYHAYNRSDGAGAEAKRSLRRSTQRRIE